MVIMGVHLMMLPTLTALELRVKHVPKKKSKNLYENKIP